MCSKEMKMDRIVRLLLCAVAIGCLTPASAMARCRIPSYEVANDFVGPGGTGAMFVSVKPADFKVQDIICLVESLKRENPKWQFVTVSFFTSPLAAIDFQPTSLGVESDLSEAYRAFRALYVRNVSAAEDYLELYPLGYGTSASLNTRIDLPPTGSLCGYKVKSRCLLGLQDTDASISTRGSRPTGSVVLNTTIGRDGHLVGIKVAHAESDGPAGNIEMVALRHVETWWFEPAVRADAIRITYYSGAARLSANTTSGALRLDLSDTTITAEPRP
jgi:hypothetical protein